MIFGFIIGVIFALLNILMGIFPVINNILSGFGNSIQFLLSSAMAWNFLFPVSDALGIIDLAIRFELACALFLFVRWVVELIRGK
jgi:hypothetical protein